MRTEIFNNIDLLVNMSGTDSNIDEVSTELLTIKKEINNKKQEIEDLKSLMIDSRYFNASLELVDKNIEISLKNKIKVLNKKIKNLESTIKDIKNYENSMHIEIENLKDKLNKNEGYVEVLREKASNKDNKYYQELLKKEESNVEVLNKELNDKNNRYEEILKELELNNQALVELNEELENKKERLDDVLDCLNNPNSYMDEDLRASDKEKLNDLKQELELLEKKKVLYLTDACMIGADAKELIANNLNSEALNKVKELVTIVKSRPYMDITNMNVLDEELEKKERLREELANKLSSKGYLDIESDAVKNRTHYISIELEELDKSIEVYQSEINKIDKFINEKLGDSITGLEKEIETLEKVISKYRELHKDKNKSIKSKVNIESAITKKIKEKRVLDELLVSYKDSLTESINSTNVLNNLIVSIKKRKDKYLKELDELENINFKDYKTKDFIEEESDKDKLRELNEEIKQIKIRKEYNKLPDEIYDEIEMTLDSVKDSSKNGFRYNNLNVDNLYEGIILDEIPEKNSELFNNNNIINSDEKMSTDMTNERIKVVNMIPVKQSNNSSGVIGEHGGDSSGT